MVPSRLALAFALSALASACAVGVDDLAFPDGAAEAVGSSVNDAAGEMAVDAQGNAQADAAMDAATDGTPANDSSADSIASPEGGDGPPSWVDSAVGSGDATAESGDAGVHSGDAAAESAADAPPDAPVDVFEGSTIDAGVTGRVVFVSSALYDGNLGGLSGADSKCQGLASAAGLSGTYKAWLSDSTTSAASRLTHASASTPYVLTDGTVVAQGWSQLVNGVSLLHAIAKTESGGAPPVGSFQCGGSDPTVWTNTDPSGKPLTASSNCSNWTSNAVAPGFVGVASFAQSPWWTEDCQSGPGLAQVTCADTAALYCIQQ
jgi:hypothetical protein